MSPVQNLTVDAEEAGIRLDRWFKRRFPEVTHGRLEKWLRTGQVRVDGKRVKAAARLEEGQTVRVPPVGDGPPSPALKAAARPTVSDADAEAIRACVLHRDDHVIAIDKPAGLAVQGGSGVRRSVDSMLDALRFGAKERPRLVHRLDKDTSGVLLLARSARAAAQLTQTFRSKEARKVYWAVVVGRPKLDDGRIDAPLAKLPGQRGERVTVHEDMGKRAVTHYRVVDNAGRRASWLWLEPLTGRTHQLRVHCAEMGTPILGDGKYGGSEAFLGGDAVARQVHLHARAIRIPHPAGGRLEVTAPLPAHFQATFRFFGFEEADAGPTFDEDE